MLNGKPHYFNDPCSIAMLVITRGYTIIYPNKSHEITIKSPLNRHKEDLASKCCCYSAGPLGLAGVLWYLHHEAWKHRSWDVNHRPHCDRALEMAVSFGVTIPFYDLNSG